MAILQRPAGDRSPAYKPARGVQKSRKRQMAAQGKNPEIDPKPPRAARVTRAIHENTRTLTQGPDVLLFGHVRRLQAPSILPLCLPRAAAPGLYAGIDTTRGCHNMFAMQRFRALLTVALVLVPLRASALGVDTGLGLGAVQVGSTGYFSVSPHIGLTLGGPHGPILTFHNVLMLMPTGKDVGINNQIVIGAGYEGKRFTVTAGALMAVYRIPSCGRALCGVVMGLAPGGFAQLDALMTDSVGIRVRGTMAWYGGQSRVLPSELSWSLAAGPVLRWR